MPPKAAPDCDISRNLVTLVSCHDPNFCVCLQP